MEEVSLEIIIHVRPGQAKAVITSWAQLLPANRCLVLPSAPLPFARVIIDTSGSSVPLTCRPRTGY